MAYVDGVCEECGNTGAVGEICSFCGNKISPLDADKFEKEDFSMTLGKKAKATTGDDDFDIDLDADVDLDEIEDDLDEMEDMDGTGSVGTQSLDEMAEEEDATENKEADLKHINIDEDNDEDTP